MIHKRNLSFQSGFVGTVLTLVIVIDNKIECKHEKENEHEMQNSGTICKNTAKQDQKLLKR
jgi:hypothetical protein